MKARLYSNENFPLPVVESLRQMGHDVLTTRDAGKSNAAIPDEEVLAFAIAAGRAVLTDQLLQHIAEDVVPARLKRNEPGVVKRRRESYQLMTQPRHVMRLLPAPP